ncbi:MAG: hypothetical protein D6812_13385 [Deltaproteobacteria bacterium]|nr:MAG: hypothetical protein D6812_13385 [Deltaproteobacteria bacterium]
MLRVALAPCSPFSVTEDLLRETVRLARSHGVRCHTHLAETLDEERYCLERYGARPLEYMERLEWLGPDIWFAHAVHLDDAEIERMGNTRTGVAHCPVSNLRLGSGIAPIVKMLERNVPVGLGVDGSASNDSSNMLGELKQALRIHRIDAGVDRMPARRVLRMATRGGAEVLGYDEIGILAPGKAADVVLFDLRKIGYAGAMHDPVAALLFCGDDDRAHTTIVNGRIVVSEGRLLTIDEEALFAEANALAARFVGEAARKTGIPFLRREVE